MEINMKHLKNLQNLQTLALEIYPNIIEDNFNKLTGKDIITVYDRQNKNLQRRKGFVKGYLRCLADTKRNE